jgi:hypothetical protein
MGQVYAAGYAVFIVAGGEYPAKFVLDGELSKFGTWPGICFWLTVHNGGAVDDLTL